MVVLYRGEHGERCVEVRHGPGILVSTLARLAAVNIVEVWVVDMEAIWADSDDWTVFFMKISDPPYILSRLNHIIVEFIPRLSAPPIP